MQEIELRVWVAKVVQEEDVDVAEKEVGYDREVVEPSPIVHLVSQEAIWIALFVLSEKAPVHVDIPDKAIRSLNELAEHIEPEKLISLILEPRRTARLACQEVEDRGGDQASEVLQCVPEVDRVLPVTIVVFAEALHHPPPVRQEGHQPEVAIRCGTLIRLWGRPSSVKARASDVALDACNVLQWGN